MSISLSNHFNYKTLLKFTLPSIIMMIVTSIYSIVDGFFVSNYVGKNAFAALNLIMPFLTALSAFGFMIGTGGSALVAKTLGEGKKEEASEIFSMLIYVMAGVGIVLSFFGFLFMPQIAELLGASASLLSDCVIYGRVLMVALPFFMLQNSYQSFLVAAEKPKMGLIISIITGIMNMILDFTLVYLCRGGILGAAAATAISQITGCVIPTIYLARKNSSLLRLTKPKKNLSALGKACSNGSSEMLTNISASLVGMLYNFQLMDIAAENGVAAYGVLMYVNFVFMAFFFGYAVACGPVVGYHYGAGNKAELKSLLRKSTVITLAVAVSMTFLAEVLAMPLAKIYVGYDAALCEMTVNGMRLYALSFLVCGFNIFGSAYFTGLNNGLVSAAISFLRTLVIQVAAIFILPIFFGLDGIWLAITVAEGLTLIITFIFFAANRKRYGY